MTLDEAKALLATCERDELRDHAFGDMEIVWTRDGVSIASGYFGHDAAGVSFDGVAFEDDDARALRHLGRLAGVHRNDTTGEDEWRGA